VRIIQALALISAFALLPLAAHAANDKEKWESKAMADKPQVVLNPAKAYIAVQGDYQVNPLLMKRPNAEEAAKHAAARSEELAKEHAKWVKKHDSWKSAMAVYAKADPSLRRPTEPQEPTEANFPWPRYEQVHPVYIGPQNRFAKAEGGASTYLHEVEPGEYLFYGNVAMAAPGGICACLGTLSFRAEAGKVTSLGKMHLMLIDVGRESKAGGSNMPTPWIGALVGAKSGQVGKSLDLPEGVTSLAFTPVPFSDPRVSADIVVPARFNPVDRVPNWFGLEVDRVMPIEGVMRYDRDKVVDLTAPASTATPAAR
jgi:hypothetical protein